MKINWKVRFNNPVFWANLAAAVVLPMLAHLGMSWQEMTSWGALFDAIIKGLGNPIVVVSVVVSVWNLLNDPTTPGLSDSARAMTYVAPGKSEETA